MTIKYPGKAARLKIRVGKSYPERCVVDQASEVDGGCAAYTSMIITPKLSSNLPIFGNQRVDFIAPCNSAATVPEF